MTNQQQIDLAKDQLNRVLSFFPRLDAKASVVLALNTGMLAFLATHAPAIHMFTVAEDLASGAFVLFVVVGLWFLYHGGSPDLEGGQQSLVYFREIAARTEAKYVDEFLQVDEKTYLKDMLGQVWRNSEILAIKFKCLQRSLACLAFSLIPWVIALALFVIR